MIAVIKRTNQDSDFLEIEHGTIEDVFLKTRNGSFVGDEIESISIFKDVTLLERRISEHFDRISIIADVASAIIQHDCFKDTADYARMLYFVIDNEMGEVDKLTHAINEDRSIQEQQETE